MSRKRIPMGEPHRETIFHKELSSGTLRSATFDIFYPRLGQFFQKESFSTATGVCTQNHSVISEIGMFPTWLDCL